MTNTIFRNIPEQLASQLRRQILAGGLPAGESLAETAVASSFGVSRGPVREAFRMLTQEGLLVATPNKGVTVGERPSESVRPLMAELRFTIEEFALAAAFDKFTDDDIGSFQQILDRLLAACKAGDTAAMVEQDLNFHAAILASHDEEGVASLWRPIAHRMLIHYGRHGDLMESYAEHLRILDAIKAKDLEGAKAALKANIQ